jgi:hypothetical protein
MRQTITDQKAYLENFYRRNFSIDANFSGIKIPEFDDQKYFLIIIPAGLFFEKVLDVAEKIMGVRIENNLTFGGRIASIREAETDYFVLVSKNLTKLSFLGSGYVSSRAKDQVTLTEGIICMMIFFEKNSSGFYNLISSIFTCGASRIEGKRNILLPGLVYDKTNKIIHIVWYDGFYAEANIDKLEVLSF